MPTPTVAARPTEAPASLPFNDLRLLLDDWGISLASKNLSKNTISSYRRCALNMIGFLVQQGMPVTTNGVKREHVESFIAYQLDVVSEATAAKHYRSLQQLFRWLESDGEITTSPMAKMSPPKVEDKPVPVIDVETMEKLLATCKGNTYENRRDAALLTFMYDSGCRVGEIVGMTIDDYDVQRKLVTVTGKGNRTRGIGTGTKTIEALRRYLRHRAAHPYAERTNAFWLGRKGGLTVSGIAQILTRRCTDAGVEHIHPHQFRHTFGHNWQAAGGNETDLMNAAGWRSRDMVARYGRSAAAGRAQEAHRNLSAADRLLK